MSSFLFLHSAMKDPYSHYRDMLVKSPVVSDPVAHCRIIYSYDLCRSILTNKDAHIPPINLIGLDDEAKAIAERLVRLSNGGHHSITSQAAMHLFRKMKPIPAEKILGRLLPTGKNNHEIDWVSIVCKKLPLLKILEGFDFGGEDGDFIIENIQAITSLMQPVKSEKEIALVNDVFKHLHELLKRHILNTSSLRQSLDDFAASSYTDLEEALELFISNMSGLIIQCYDAGNGILSNSLHHFLKSNSRPTDIQVLHKAVVEVIRFDPPVHNTRRIANTNITLGQFEVEKGELIVVMLAAANRDEGQFIHANSFDLERSNNDSHLTFGFGAHNCIARAFSTHLAVETLDYLFKTYSTLRLLEQAVEYEPKMNVRLISRLQVAFN